MFHGTKTCANVCYLTRIDVRNRAKNRYCGLLHFSCVKHLACLPLIFLNIKHRYNILVLCQISQFFGINNYLFRMIFMKYPKQDNNNNKAFKFTLILELMRGKCHKLYYYGLIGRSKITIIVKLRVCLHFTLLSQTLKVASQKVVLTN